MRARDRLVILTLSAALTVCGFLLAPVAEANVSQFAVALRQVFGGVDVSGATDGQVLTWDATAAQWEAADASGAAAAFAGCMLGLSTDHALASSATASNVPWDTEDFDTDAFHDTVTNNDRIVIPSGGAGYYVFSLGIFWDTNPQDDQAFMRVSLFRASADNDFFGVQNTFGGRSNNASGTATTPPVYMAEGDYATALVQQVTGSPIDFRAEDSHFGCWKVGE